MTRRDLPKHAPMYDTVRGLSHIEGTGERGRDMNDRLRAVIDRAEQLPDADQEALARLLEEELEEREWEALTRRPGAHAFHEELRAELREAEERGEVEEIEEDHFG